MVQAAEHVRTGPILRRQRTAGLDASVDDVRHGRGHTRDGLAQQVTLCAESRSALATATLPVTPHLFLYDEMVLAIPVALLVRIGLADGFSEYELPALGCVALLLMSFPWVSAPVSLGATLIVAVLIVRRAGGTGTTMMSNMSTL